MKEPDSSLKKLALVAIWTGFWTVVGGGIAKWLWTLTKAYMPAAASSMAQVSHYLLPTAKGLLVLSHALYWICIPLLVIPFSYTVIREFIYVDRIYVVRDLLEAGKLRPEDLTEDQFRFIYGHWPDLFEPKPPKK